MQGGLKVEGTPFDFVQGRLPRAPRAFAAQRLLNPHFAKHTRG